MVCASKRAVLRWLAFQSIVKMVVSQGDSDNALSIEFLCSGIPRLLGRGRPNQTALPSRETLFLSSNDMFDLPNGYYLSGLAGSSCAIRQQLRLIVHNLFKALVPILAATINRLSKESLFSEHLEADSMTLSVLSLFSVALKRDDVKVIISDSDLLGCIGNILSVHRSTAFGQEHDDLLDNSESVSILNAVCQRDVSRSIVRCATAVVHILLYQAADDETLDSFDPTILAACMSASLDELEAIFPHLERESDRVNADISRSKLVCGANLWASIHAPAAVSEASVRQEYTGLVFFKENGSTLNAIARISSVKPQSSKSATTKSSQTSYSPCFSQQCMSQWLNLVCSAIRNNDALSMIATDSAWLDMLMFVCGVKIQIDSEGQIVSASLRQYSKGFSPVSARIRSRLLHFLATVIVLRSPNQELVQCLFSLAGSSSYLVSTSMDGNESLVSREAVSVLRSLHAPNLPQWRDCVNKAIEACAACGRDDPGWFAKQVGVLVFLSGDIIPIIEGSFVLLKPSPAIALSQGTQASSNVKAQSASSAAQQNQSTSSHHVAGNGTESILTGLCRHEASTGIVSSVDLKNGSCEVILMSGEDSVQDGPISSSKGNSRKSLHAFTIRAIRTPLSDVVLKQESSLYIGIDVPVGKIIDSMLANSVQSLLSTMSPLSPEVPPSVSPAEGESPRNGPRSGILSLSLDLHVLRSCIVILSERRLLLTFLGSSESSVLRSMLRLASPNIDDSSICASALAGLDFSSLNLSSLPLLQARLCHLTSMMRELTCWSNAMRDEPEDELHMLVKRLIATPADQATQAERESVAVNKSPSASDNRVETVDSSGTRHVGTSGSSQSGTFAHEVGGRDRQANAGESDAAAAAAHLFGVALAQMAELGLPRSWSEFALRRTGGADIEAAVTFCLERGGDMERLIAEERERVLLQGGGNSSSRRRAARDAASDQLLTQLLEMGFPRRWCVEALTVTGNNVDEALTWILMNGERLGEEEDDDDDDEADMNDEDDGSVDDDDDDDDDYDDDDEVENDADDDVEMQRRLQDEAQLSSTTSSDGWTGCITPVRFISGRASIDNQKLEVSGLPTGGFSSVGTKGVLLTTGRWYYEAVLETAGCLQIGWADASFASHCSSDRGDGCGDGPSSWAYDGWRRYRWHSSATEWGCRWKEGDTVGCMVDLDERSVTFTLNGQSETIGMGVAFSGEGFRPVGGVYVCVSFNRKEKLRLILGGKGNEPFRFGPPLGYRGVGEAVMDAVDELDSMLANEVALGLHQTPEAGAKRYLCDFSDGDHGHELMAWSHRYFGADASVHLGSGRAKQTGLSKSSSTPCAETQSTSTLVTNRVRKLLLKESTKNATADDDLSASVVSQLSSTYQSIMRRLAFEAFKETMVMSMLLARKLILHVLITAGAAFDPCVFTQDDNDENCMVLLWKVLEACASLRNAGWVGEAGAMALAAEALGLGISSNDPLGRGQPEKLGMIPSGDLDEGLYLSCFGTTQLLAGVVSDENSTSSVNALALPCAAAEPTMGSDSAAGLLAFLRVGLQSAICQSGVFRNMIIAVIRRSVRLLSVVEYDSAPGQIREASKNYGVSAARKRNTPHSFSLLHITQCHEESERNDVATQSSPQGSHSFGGLRTGALAPDARLVSFLTGALLSVSVREQNESLTEIKNQLAAIWSIGLLSASIPWRMISAFIVAGILNQNPRALLSILAYTPTIARYFGRLPSTVVRRIWAERAASPICSKYVQALVELLNSVKRAVPLLEELPSEFARFWYETKVDAACPLPLQGVFRSDEHNRFANGSASWESLAGYVSCDDAWEIWTGSVEYMAVDWKVPSKSGVRSLMDAGEGPPFLGPGCYVLRGPDWDRDGHHRDDDGKSQYDSEKERRNSEKRRQEEIEQERSDDVNPAESSDDKPEDPAAEMETPDLEPTTDDNVSTAVDTEQSPPKPKKQKLPPNPKLPLGTVISIEPWNGVDAMARRVRWHLTGEEGVYRVGGDGGLYDICHVEVNEKQTRVKKKHPLPETAEQCAARHGFGRRKVFNVLLRLRRDGVERIVDGSREIECQGVLEWPDFDAGARVTCVLFSDGAVSIEEQELLFGAKDCGWEARFGQPSFVAGTMMLLSPTSMSSAEHQPDLDVRSSWLSDYDELLGSNTYPVKMLRNIANGKTLQVTSEMRLFRSRREAPASAKESPASSPAPMLFDKSCHASSISLSRDRRTASCVGSEGRGTAFSSMGFSKGVHYWEIKLEQADIGSVFIGVAEKPNGSGSGSTYGFDSPPKLNRWHGWGFVNFRATYTSGAERVYGAHCHGGDTVGVLLDCDSGRVSFFFDGLKYGEHILNDLGCAFENLSPFGFNVDGCGSGGYGQGAPSGFENGRSGRHPVQGAVRPRTLWPVIGLRNQGDRVTISHKWNSSYGIDAAVSLRNIVAFDDVLHGIAVRDKDQSAINGVPDWFVREAYDEYRRWWKGRWLRSETRGSGPFKHSNIGLAVDFDTSPKACAAASASIGIPYALLSGDRVRLTRSAGRILELAEEAVVLGAFQGRLYYRILSHKSEGGSLTEGGGRAWCWDESEVVDGLPFTDVERGLGVKLPKLDRFKCLASGGLRIVYEGGAVLRSDLEIFEGSANLGTIPVNTVLSREQVIERRVNSCGVVRYRVSHPELGEGWISARIRGGKEEFIVETASDGSIDLSNEKRYPTPADCANAWYKVWSEKAGDMAGDLETLKIEEFDTFRKLLTESGIRSLTPIQSDSIVAQAVSAISNFCEEGNGIECRFRDVASAFSFALRAHNERNASPLVDGASSAAKQAIATIFAIMKPDLPSLHSLLARVAFLKAFNRRACYALPWISLRPCQEGTSLLGGLSGYGTSPDRAGRTRTTACESWVSVPSMATKIREARGLLFTSVKRDFLESITECTTTPTPLSHDEYELPREIRTVRVNRLKATRAMLSGESATRRKHSVFAQLQSETKNWGAATLRRGYVAKGHGGQKRAFKVKLIGEGVNDYSGPYREIFTDAVRELTSTDSNGSGLLGVLDPTPNNVAGIGEGRDLFMFSLNGRTVVSAAARPTQVIPESEAALRRHFSSLMVHRDETTLEVEDALVFLGRLTGTAFRHGISVDLPLPLELVWKSLTEDNVSEEAQLQELDYLAARQREDTSEPSPLLVWQQRMLNSFVEGLGNIIPIEVLPLFTGQELRETICGNPEVDVELLQQVVEYEGFDESDATVQYFWETLREFTHAERQQFLQFVWARNRLPMRAADFDAPFKLLKDASYSGARADQALPSASTCFFSLTLPAYSSREVLKQKLLFAIQNVTTMETDYQTNSAEIAEGYRAL